jgi:hypothetical protein
MRLAAFHLARGPMDDTRAIFVSLDLRLFERAHLINALGSRDDKLDDLDVHRFEAISGSKHDDRSG